MKTVYYWQLRIYDHKIKGWRGSEEFESFDKLLEKYGKWIGGHPDVKFNIVTRKSFVSI